MDMKMEKRFGALSGATGSISIPLSLFQKIPVSQSGSLKGLTLVQEIKVHECLLLTPTPVAKGKNIVPDVDFMGRGLLITCIMVPDYWKTICKLSYLRS
jgi:hypothetical protein